MTIAPNANRRLRLAAIAGCLYLSCCQTLAEDFASGQNNEPPRGPLVIGGQVVNQELKPVSGAIVHVQRDPNGLRFHTAADGKFEIPWTVPGNLGLRLISENADGSLQGILDLNRRTIDAGRLILKPARKVKVMVTDKEGAPLDEAQVVVVLDSLYPLTSGKTNPDGSFLIRVNADATVAQIAAYKPGEGFTYLSTLTSKTSTKRLPLPESVELKLSGARTARLKAVDSAGNLMSGVTFYPWYLSQEDQPEIINLSGCADLVGIATAADGIASFDWLPAGHKQGFPFDSRSSQYDQKSTKITVDHDSGDLTVSFLRRSTISGRVTYPDGRPAANIAVHAGIGPVFTMPDGSYEMAAVSNHACFARIEDDYWASPNPQGVIVREGRPVNGADIVLQKGTIIRGRVTLDRSDQPAPNALVSVTQHFDKVPAEFTNTGEHVGIFQDQREVRTDATGNYRLCVGPGTFTIRGARFVVTTQSEIIHNLRNPSPPIMGELLGRVIDAQGSPVAGAKIVGAYRRFEIRRLVASTRSDGGFAVERGMYPAILFASNADETQAGIIEIDAKQRDVTIQLRPVASASGQLICPQGNPLPHANITYGVQVFHDDPGLGSWSYHFGNKLETDAEGRYVLKCLVPGQEYKVRYRTPKKAVYIVGCERLDCGWKISLADVEKHDDAISRRFRRERTCRTCRPAPA